MLLGAPRVLMPAPSPTTKFRIFQVDAFTSHRFKGNPAAVMPLDRFLDDRVLQAIATENNLSETAFLVPKGSEYLLRWFTPSTEVPLCGHATLASAAVVMERLEPGRDSVVFHSASGPLTVRRKGDRYAMDFPARPSEKIPVPPAVRNSLGIELAEVWSNEFNFMAVLDRASQVRDVHPDLPAVAQLDRPGLIVTAPGEGSFDFVSRYFTPKQGVPEDPVTGSAHCMLAPYWARRLGRSELRAYQASSRGGEILCRVLGNRVELEGECAFYMEGQAQV
jgi:PhzF family phenazine biosynthesis protein